MLDVVDRVLESVNSHDLEACIRCYSRTAAMVGPEMQAEGHDQIASYHAHVWEAIPDIHMVVRERITEGDRVMVEGILNGTHTRPFLIAGGEFVEPSNRRVSIRVCWVFTTEDGVIASHRLYFDQLELYTQLGVPLPRTAS
ncbi:ester cyclase [Microbispora sp. NPDC049125]|uniref:ester cyclase n=1 Tax=Microbispora sp. NPDC049125 TaxID=3154929 RepID=UPI0034651F5A